jgi:hypothetical protein
MMSSAGIDSDHTAKSSSKRSEYIDANLKLPVSMDSSKSASVAEAKSGKTLAQDHKPVCKGIALDAPESELWTDATTRRQLLTSKSVDVRSISFVLRDPIDSTGKPSLSPSSSNDYHVGDCIGDVGTGSHARHRKHSHSSASSGNSTPQSRCRRNSFKSTQSSNSKREWSIDSTASMKVESAVEAILGEYQDSVVKEILRTNEHKTLLHEMKKVADIKLKLFPIQENIYFSSEAESAKLKKIRRHRSELESVCQIVKNNGTSTDNSPFDNGRRRSPSTSSSPSVSSVWTSPMTGSSAADSVNSKKSKHKETEKGKGSARKISKKILSMISPKTTDLSASQAFKEYEPDVKKSPSISSLPKSDSVGSGLSEHSEFPLHGMLRTVSGSQITTKDISSSADGVDLEAVTPREGSESCDSTDDPDLQAIRRTRNCITELKVG